MKINSSTLLLYIFTGLVVIGVFIFAMFKPGVVPGQYDEFAQCLTDSGATMYGAYWCSHCENQKEMFGDSFKLVDYVECADPEVDGMKQECADAGIEGYPTWILGDGQVLPGEVPLEYLAEVTSCELPVIE